MRMSLKTKLALASCGPLLILLAVGLLSIRTITESSSALERSFRENYNSVVACMNMKQAIQEIERSAEAYLWEGGSAKNVSRAAILKFSRSLKLQQGNVTLPGEQELTDRLAESWKIYNRDLEGFLQMPETGVARLQFYRTRLLPDSDSVLHAAQQIVDINLKNMISTDGQVRRRAAVTNRDVIALVLTGAILSLMFIIIIGPSILTPDIQPYTLGQRDSAGEPRSCRQGQVRG